MKQENNYFNFGHVDGAFRGENPLDFLLSDREKDMKQTPRSSFESSDRQLEIPICDPPFIRARQDSNRSRHSGHLNESVPFAA